MRKPEMCRLTRKSGNGFTLVELLIAMLVTAAILAGAVQLCRQSLETADLTVRRSEVQTEVRAALNQSERDLSQAGTGVRLGGVPIPSAATGGADPNFACDINQCYLGANVPFTQGTLYRVTPGNAIGPNITEPSDAIKITYVDPNLDWSAVSTTAIAANGSSLTMPAGTLPAVNDLAVGISVGDVLLLQNGIGSAVGVATGVAGPNISFGFAPLNIHHTIPPSRNIRAIATPASNPVTCPATKVSRVLMISSGIQPVVTPDGPDSRPIRPV